MFLMRRVKIEAWDGFKGNLHSFDKLTRDWVLMRNMGRLYSLLLIGLLAVACNPNEGKQKATCGANMAFNSISRKCYAVNAPRSAPSPSTISASINEDSAGSTVTLSYTDTESDFANSCSIVSYSATIDGNGLAPVSCSCTGGVCTAVINPDSNFYGLAQFVYQLSDDDGTSASKTVALTVVSIDDAPVNTSSVPTSPALINVSFSGTPDGGSRLAVRLAFKLHSPTHFCAHR